jgi:hypothetical protein
VEGDCLGAVAEGRDMRKSGLLARGRQDAASAVSAGKMDGEAARQKARERKAEVLHVN